MKYFNIIDKFVKYFTLCLFFSVVEIDGQLVQAAAAAEHVFVDAMGETVPGGPKIYAIRAPPPNAPRHIREQPRTVGIIFNWNQTIGYRRANDNARSFVHRRGVQGSYGSLQAAYRAAQAFLAEPSVPEGDLDPRPVFDGYILSIPSYTLAYFWYSVSNMGMSAKAVFACLTLSTFMFVSYTTVLMLEEELGCTRTGNTKFLAAFNGVNPVCQNLTDLKNHVQKNSTEYINLFFTQLKIGFVLLARYIIDEMFR